MKNIFRKAMERCRSNFRWLVSVKTSYVRVGCERGILGLIALGLGEGPRVSGGSNEKYLQNGIGAQ